MREKEIQGPDDESWISIHLAGVMIGLALVAVVIIAAAYIVYFKQFSGPLSLRHDVWGTFGDFIGGVLNPVLSFIAFIALLLTIVLQSRELKFTRYEIRLSREAQQESKESIVAQAKLMKDSATLSALGNIYNHYGGDYGSDDKTNTLKNVASGHRSWAIRESFSIIDQIFESNREKLVNDEFLALIELLYYPKKEVGYLNSVGWLVGSLIVDRRLNSNQRQCLWPLYEFLRRSSSLVDRNKVFDDLSKIASNIVDSHKKDVI